MEYPVIKSKPKARQMIETFLGYNHNLRIGDGEFYDMENMSSDHFPTLAPRKARKIIPHNPGGVQAIASIGEYLTYVKDGKLVIESWEIPLGLTDGSKQIIQMGTYVIIMPDKKWVRFDDYSKPTFGDIEAQYTTHTETEFSLCNLAGKPYDAQPLPEEPQDPSDGQMWMDTSDKPPVLKKYSAKDEKWISIPTTYVKIESLGIGREFAQYDGVEISGITLDGLTVLNGSHVIWGIDDDAIIIQGIIQNVGSQEAPITISRKMPVMDFVFEANNRLWGCRYGLNANGEFVNEIYASKLGDFKNWNCYMGISTDSYGISVGTDGLFTGGIAFGGNPIFFKEDCLLKVYGEMPSSFRLQTVMCSGTVSPRSLAVVNNILFYHSRNGVCAYDGSLPSEMSDIFGEIRYYGGVAGVKNNKYYLSMHASGANQTTFVFDTHKRLWHKEDGLSVKEYCNHSGDLYALENNGDIHILEYSSTESDIPWMVETGLIGMTMPDMKYITKLLVRLSLAENASVRFLIQYDSVGDWKQLCSLTATTLRSYSVPILPRRCDHFRMRIEGNGDCKIYSITKTIEQGSDVS